ncbi:QueE-like queosine biosynthesis protein [Arthrobacter phage Sonali]|uniref:QueE-like queosine biosynthesis protein n=1 Tax=Arthrobacter phage Sonali TaxID=2510495 RepID=A0A411CQV0_9CAUD|nr:QueE-like radical SAM domain [Arthrobacter phage Sonali]QAY16202.1 QueE-like queosine biosynthesis protein [Arthrobacter phage Sonali]
MSPTTVLNLSQAKPDAPSHTRLPFVEAFGPTLQGEGPAAGRLASFIRLGGCNLACSWCDSPYTWDASRFDLRKEIEVIDFQEAVDRIPDAPIVVITGGEPLMSQRTRAWPLFLQALRARFREIHVETNGTIVPNQVTLAGVDKFIVSPKQPHAGVHKKGQNPALALGWGPLHDHFEAHLKVVVEDAEGVAAAADLADNHHWPKERVWVMPEGTTAEVLASRFPEVATAATHHHINCSHRLHVLAWTDARGH